MYPAPRKRKRQITYCDSIAWFVDILGTTDLLAMVSKAKIYVGQRANEKKPGLYFYRGHWYSSKDGVKKDSYSLGYQVRGSASFCQTYATMIYMGEDTELEKKEYNENIKKALDFWITIFTNQSGVVKFFLKEIHTSEYKMEYVNIDDLIGEPDVKLGKLTKIQLMTYLTTVKNASLHLTNCQEGLS